MWEYRAFRSFAVRYYLTESAVIKERKKLAIQPEAQGKK